jgi:HD-like signal output (HDOD) protein
MSQVVNQHPSHHSLDEWTNRLLEKELPIFSTTAQRITEIIGNRSAGAMELASTILQDPTLTAKTLKLANSSYYNPSRQKLGTITRAIVILGSQTVHNLSITCAFIDSALKVEEQERINEELAIAIHAAVQAKQLALLAEDPSPEEIFVAALLKNLGAISFWCSGDDDSTQALDRLLKTEELPSKQAETEVLGFQLSRLGVSLSHKWQLSSLIKEVISGHSKDDKRALFVQQGHQLATQLGKKKSPEALKSCLEEISESNDIPLRDLKQNVAENSKSAAKMAKQFGAHKAAALINPALSKNSQKEPKNPSTKVIKTDLEKPKLSTDSHEVQLQILDEISSMLEGDINLNHLFEMVIEGIQRGTQMDRTLFTLLNPSRSLLREKTSLGWFNEAEHTPFSLSLDSKENNLFKEGLSATSPTWICPDENPRQKLLFTADVQKRVQINSCFTAPIKVNKKIIGLLYADRASSNRPLNQSDFNSFCQFSRQANIGLMLSQTR